ncbi:MAG: hypothetical protein RR246_00390 [Clostridia bacterium]
MNNFAGLMGPANNGTNPVVAKIKSLAAGKLFFWTSLMFTISIAARILKSVFYFAVSYESNFSESIESYTTFTSFASIAAFIVPVITCIFMWKFYQSGKSKYYDGVSEKPITSLKITVIVSLSLLVAIFIFIAISIAIVAMVGNFETTEFKDIIDAFKEQFEQNNLNFDVEIGIKAVLLVFSMIIAVSIVLLVIYYTSIIRTLSKIEKTLKMGTVKGKASIVLVVFLILEIFTMCFSLGAGVTSSQVSTILTILNALFALPSIGANILFVLCILKYNSAMENLLYITPDYVCTYAKTEPASMQSERIDYIPETQKKAAQNNENSSLNAAENVDQTFKSDL